MKIKRNLTPFPFTSLQMQIETGMPAKWSGRVPPLDLSAVTVCPRETECRWTSTHQQRNINSPRKTIKQNRQRIGPDGLPVGKLLIQVKRSRDNNLIVSPISDPREWTRKDVWLWLGNIAQSEGLPLTTELAQKFPMNGKALCLMSLDMYLSRVPVGGKMLYKDFRIRLARGMSI